MTTMMTRMVIVFHLFGRIIGFSIIIKALNCLDAMERKIMKSIITKEYSTPVTRYTRTTFEFLFSNQSTNNSKPSATSPMKENNMATLMVCIMKCPSSSVISNEVNLLHLLCVGNSLSFMICPKREVCNVAHKINSFL